MSKPQSKMGTALSDDEIHQALEGAGYPLELRLYELLKEGGMDPRFGFRTKLADSDVVTREVDLLASRHICFPDTGREKATSALLTAVIQAKKIHDACVVGFRGSDQPLAQDLRSFRSSAMAGLPFWRALDDGQYDGHVGDEFYSERGLGAAFDHLSGAPVCIQWTVVKRVEKYAGAARAEQEAGVFDDIATSVRACMFMARDFTRFVLTRSSISDLLPQLNFYVPVLIVDAPLRVYDAANQTLSSVDWFTARVTIDTCRGNTPALVDVVSASAVPALMKRFADAADALEQRLRARGANLALMGAAQFEHFKKDQIREAFKNDRR